MCKLICLKCAITKDLFVDQSPWTNSHTLTTLEQIHKHQNEDGYKLKNNIKLAFGQILRKYRLQQKLSQEKLAELADLDRTYISQIERGLKSPSISTLIALVGALNTKAHLLISEVESELENRCKERQRHEDHP